MKKILVWLMLLVSISLSAETLKVGLYDSPPFVMKDINGNYTGLVVDIWEKSASDLGLEYEYVEHDGGVNDMVELVSSGYYDLALSSTTINSQRMEVCDFLVPYYVTDICIASSKESSNSVLSTLSNIFSMNFLKYVLSLIILLLFVAVLLWLAERKKNDDFSPTAGKGILEGFYFMSVVMTTVGFGDKTAKTPIGRFIVLLWMFISLGITGIFIGNISSAITVNRLDNGVEDISELNKTKVGSLLNTTSADYLEEREVKFVGYNSVEEGLDDIVNGRLETFVYDTPVLKHLIKTNNYNLVLSDKKFDNQYYGIPINCDDELKTRINQSVMDFIDSELWEYTLIKYDLN